MLGWVGDIEQATLDNTTFRTVLFTGEHTQLTVMRLAPGEHIGREAHPHLDQFLRVEQGRARVELGGTEDSIDETHEVEDDWAIVVPPASGTTSSTRERPSSSCTRSTRPPSTRRGPSTAPKPTPKPPSTRANSSGRSVGRRRRLRFRARMRSPARFEVNIDGTQASVTT